MTKGVVNGTGEGRIGVASVGGAVGLAVDLEIDDALRVGDGEGLEQHGIHDAEDGGVGADAEGHDQDDGEGEAGRVSERAEGVSEIAQDALEEGEAVLIPEIFVDAAGGAELDAGAAFGLFRGEAAGEVLGALCVEVRGDLAGEITITATAAEEANPAHGMFSLLGAQGLCGIELRGAPGGDGAGDGGGEGEDDDDGGEDAPVEGAHAVEHLAQELDSGGTAGEADDETDEDGREAVGEGEAHDSARAARRARCGCRARRCAG